MTKRSYQTARAGGQRRRAAVASQLSSSLLASLRVELAAEVVARQRDLDPVHVTHGEHARAGRRHLDRDLAVPDGIRMLDPARLLVAELVGRLTLVDVDTGMTTVVSELDQPTSVVRVGGSLWVSEGQVLRLLSGQPPNLPFNLRRLSLPTLPRVPGWAA